MTEPLNAFEQRLLGELQALQGEPRHGERPRRRTTTRRVLVAAAAALVAASGALVANTVRAEPAWAVQAEGGGPVRITINRPEGASALRQRLADVGVVADVQFPPEGQRCSRDRFRGSTWVADAAGVQQGTFGRTRVELTVDPAKVPSGTIVTIEVDHAGRVADVGADALLATAGAVRGAVPGCRPVALTKEDFTQDPAHP